MSDAMHNNEMSDHPHFDLALPTSDFPPHAVNVTTAAWFPITYALAYGCHLSLPRHTGAFALPREQRLLLVRDGNYSRNNDELNTMQVRAQASSLAPTD